MADEHAGGECILVLDFGSQYALLIARRVREARVYAEVVPHTITPEEVMARGASGLILSGGPASVYAEGAPRCDEGLFRLGIPVLGICYGLQLACQAFGGKVRQASRREYGRAVLEVAEHGDLFHGLGDHLAVWMSHGDQVAELPAGFDTLASTDTCAHAAVRNLEAKYWGIQFHPEVTHTPQGAEILSNFLYRIAGCEGTWEMTQFIERTVQEVRERAGQARVVLGLSGGVDSSVAAVLLNRAIGERLICIFVDNGLLRAQEAERVESVFREHFRMDLRVVDASEKFLSRLAGVADPEKKRRIIGHTFIEVFKEAAADIEGARFLAQGTLYPDVIESAGIEGGVAAVIKTHHNVGGLPEELGFELIEPLRYLFKDEVRRIGETLGLPREVVWRHPFPGPGLAVRIVGAVTPERLRIVRDADDVLMEEIIAAGYYDRIAQAFAVLLPLRSVGVMGDERTYEHVIAIRCVDSEDFMTADWSRLPDELLGRVSNRIINEVRGVNRVCYDVSSKPPSTIEWE